MNVSEALHALKWRQTRLAKRLKVSRQTVNRWATGHVPEPDWLGEFLKMLVYSKRNLEGDDE
jgi:transcriptional regulator with XRE-family HTH domain